MKTIESWNDLLEQAHPLAKEKGWWDDMDRPIDEQVANFHAEISEAWEEYRSGRMETWYSIDGKPIPVDQTLLGDKPWKPEGFWVEIADLLIRLADTCGRYAVSPAFRLNGHRTLRGYGFAKFINDLHSMQRITFDGYRRVHETSLDLIGECVGLCVDFAGHHGIDLWPLVNKKVAYNRTRPHRHGGKVA